MTPLFIPILVGLLACPLLGINPLKLIAGLALLALTLILFSSF